MSACECVGLEDGGEHDPDCSNAARAHGIVGPLRTTRAFLAALDATELASIERWIWEIGEYRPCVLPLPTGRYAIRKAGAWFITRNPPVMEIVP